MDRTSPNPPLAYLARPNEPRINNHIHINALRCSKPVKNSDCCKKFIFAILSTLSLKQKDRNPPGTQAVPGILLRRTSSPATLRPPRPLAVNVLLVGVAIDTSIALCQSLVFLYWSLNG